MAKTIYGVFADNTNANNVVDRLLASGFNREDISIVKRDSVETREDVDVTTTEENITSSATSGAVAGGALGALAGLLVGIGAITLPPIGGIFIAGPLASALGISTAGAATIAGGGLGALGGGLVGALVGLGLPEEDAVIYEERIRNNGVLIGVSSDNQEEETLVSDIFSTNNAENVRSV